MIPAVWLARFLPYKWIAVAVLLAITAAWGGIGWHGKATAERLIERERLAAARAAADQLAANQRLSEAQARKSAEISAAYLKGKTDVAKSFQPALADLQMLRTWWDAHAGRLRVEPADDSRPVPGPAGPPGGADAIACTDRPGDIVESAHRVAQDLEACAIDLARLKALQEWVRAAQRP